MALISNIFSPSTGKVQNAGAVTTTALDVAAGTRTGIAIVCAQAEWLHATGAAGTISGVTSSAAGLTFAKRAAVTLAGVTGANPYSRLEMWWAFANAVNFNSATFTATYNLPSATNFEAATVAMMLVTGFTGTVYQTTPWDSNSSLPAIASAEASGSPSVSGVSTDSAATMLISLAGNSPTTAGDLTSGTVPTGFTWDTSIKDNSAAVNNSNIGIAHNVVAAAQSNITEAWVITVTNWTLIADALAEAGAAPAVFVPARRMRQYLRR